MGEAEYAYEIIIAKGHPNIRATHRTTFEVTTEHELTPRGDCIIGVSSTKAAADLNEDFKKIVRAPGSIVIAVLESGGYVEVVLGKGDPGLSFGSHKRIVFRKSHYVKEDTVMVEAEKAAADLDRGLVSELKKGGKLVLTLIALRTNQG